jgi:phage shock protein A
VGRLFEAIVNVVRGKANDTADKLEDPVRDGKLAIEDASKDLIEFKNEIAAVMASKRKFDRELTAAKADTKKFENIAKQAKDAGNTDDAIKSLGKMNKAKGRVIELQKSIKGIDKQITNLRSEMDKRRDTISNAESNITQLQARQHCADIRKQAAAASDKFNGNGSPFSKLEKLEGKVLEQEDEADALEELSGNDDDLESKYDSNQADLDKQLAAL